MPLPNVNLTVQDPGLGLNPPSAEGVIAVIGQAASGTDAEVKTFTDPAQAAAVYVSGALLDRIRILFAEGAATVLGIKLAAGSAGSVGAATPDGGNTGNGDLAAAGTPTIGCSAKVKIVEAGRLGTATFKYSLDAGATWSAELAVPTTPGTYAIPNTGVTLTFSEGDPAADSFKAEDLWSFTVTGPASTNANLLAAIDALTASRRNFELILIAENCAAATLAALKVKAAALETARIYTRIVCEAAGPSQGQSIDDWISAALADVANFTDTRVGSCPARALAVVNGTETDINAAALIMGRIAAIPVQRSAGKVADGPLNSAVSLTPAGINDGQITDLDTGRFMTLRHFPGRNGVYVTNAKMLAGLTSDYQYLENGRVMDACCRDVYQAGLDLINAEFSGDEDELKAVTAQLQKPLNLHKGRKHIVAGEIVIAPGQDVLATGTLRVKVRAIPWGYIRWLEVEIAFSNPAAA